MPYQLTSGGPEPIEAEYRVIEEEEEPKRRFPWQKARRFGAAAGRGLGRGIAGAGRTAGGFAGGFASGVGATIPRPTAAGTGRVVGKGVIKGAKLASRVRLRGPEHFWGQEYHSARPSRPYFYGHAERLRGAERRPTSRLDTQTQMTMVDVFRESYPQAYERLYYQGITVSEMVGTLRQVHPDIYEEIKGYASMTAGYPQSAGYITL